MQKNNHDTQVMNDIAVIGMAVMGKNLALNMADEGFQVAVFNRTTSKAVKVVEENPAQHLTLCTSLEDLVSCLKRPRKILLLVKAGAAVDSFIDQLIPLLDKGDIIMDGGNSYFKDTERRYRELEAKGIYYLGVGVSGGEEGARRGPAIMPGGSYEAYQEVEEIFAKISAKAPDGKPCQAFMGKGGAGHYVKMVHNGIEYADMELIAELYEVLSNAAYTNAEIADIFADWNKGELSSYLSEITVDILRAKDLSDPAHDFQYDEENPIDIEIRRAGAKESDYLLDHILDLSEQKGTGKWTNEEGLEQGVDLSILYAGLNARYMSSQKELRVKSSQILPQGLVREINKANIDIAATAKAFLAARLLAYAQGFSLYKAASKAYAWDLNYTDIAATFRGGCIIRSYLLVPIMAAYEDNPELENLVLAPNFQKSLAEGIPALRKFVSLANLSGISVPAFSSALNYYDALRTARSQAALISAQRDYFGAHTYRRTDREGIYHHEWSDDLKD